MLKNKTSILVALILLAILLAGAFVFNRGQPVSAAPAIFASPIQAGCYIAAPNDCRIHVDPFTIDIASGQKLVFFQLLTVQSPGNVISVVYDFHTDQSNPAPFIGSTYSPSLVAQDFGVTCGKTYQFVLEGRDSGDSTAFSLGSTTQFTCPSKVP